MQTFFLVVQFLIAVTLIGVILVQRTAQDGGGLMGGGNTMGGLFTARGSANLMSRTTGILATLFIVNSLWLGYMAGSQHQSRDMLDQVPVSSSNVPASAQTAPAAAPEPVMGAQTEPPKPADSLKQAPPPPPKMPVQIAPKNAPAVPMAK